MFAYCLFSLATGMPMGARAVRVGATAELVPPRHSPAAKSAMNSTDMPLNASRAMVWTSPLN
ncbi:hypothetical protein Y900_030100 [Mycolicibacterium aromaticivorans JS19b1 = JCM 16368]|uniref:Uncharacterized protein n=1 Tax=Mycolicibacterium aromaticivorans JS19b1 = JCM 16368 TaxID=1440774 RepID=A0A064CDU1_9MYCO|nr:hypothetical protein Y900_030100 [Mycolicibacterium aromaticivorans JS19b1 = JCM 16368]